jgi:thiamine biosynthesis protein ThiS
VIRLTVNGKPREVEGDTRLPLPQLLAAFEVNPKLVAVAINGDVIPKTSYDAAIVRDGDELEIVRMVGGGSR